MAQFRRIDETDRQRVEIVVDGTKIDALAGDTVLTAILTARSHIRESERRRSRRAGLCLMAACQDCWIWTAEGERLRACSTLVRNGMNLISKSPFQTCPS